MHKKSEFRVPMLIVAALTVFGFLRAFVLWSHEPLYAYANTYDQVRYSACFDIYPDRPASIPPDENSPNAPYEAFDFARARDPMCYWSSELVFGAITAASWHVAEQLGIDAPHSVRLIGALKLAALLITSILLSRAWLRRKNYPVAIANAALLALLFSDPGNTLYLNTFYAEWSSLLCAYVLLSLVMLWHGEARNRWRLTAIAGAAFLLAASKMQHVVLPLSLAISFLLIHRFAHGNFGWRALALLFGAFLGGYFQFVQLQREVPMMDSIRQYNRAHVVFTALLPLAVDKPAFLRDIGIDPNCAIYSGKRAWELPGLPETVCRGVLGFGYADQLRVLLQNPGLSLRLGGRAVLALDPWIAENIGQVEGRILGEISPSLPTIGTPLRTWPALQVTLLSLPFIGVLVLLIRRSTSTAGFELSALTCVTMLATLGVTVMGDGLADTAKQGHLVINVALAWLIFLAIHSLVRSQATRAKP
jgi:hypothetical protein